MNAFENWFCGSAIWGYLTREKLLPWMVQGTELGEHVLELGAGPGVATRELRRRAGRVTSLEYSHKFAAGLHARLDSNGPGGGDAGTWVAGEQGNGGAVVQGDAARLPFAERTFSSAIAVLMLHHLCSSELQRQAFVEIFRVLRPGGVFLAFEIQDGWLHRVGHIRSTFVPLQPGLIGPQLEAVGFSRVTVDFRRGSFRLRALREHGV